MLRQSDSNLLNRLKCSGKIDITRILFVLLLFLITYILDQQPILPSPKFMLHTEVSPSKEYPFFYSELIPQPKYLIASHASTLEILPNGNLLVLWFAGSVEGAADVRIWQSIYDGDKWSMATSVISPQLITQGVGAFTKKVGNPVVYLAQNGVLYLFVVSVGPIGGWSGSKINYFYSHNMGKSWYFGKTLFLSPFLNISTLVRTKIISLTDGGFYIPVYHELFRKYPALLRFDKTGQYVMQTKLSIKNNLLQPALLPLSDKIAMVYTRNSAKYSQAPLFYQKTIDGGITWSELGSTNLTNQDSSLAVAQVSSGHYIMIHNVGIRSKLAVATSVDGVTWNDVYLLENTVGKEFSYPSLQVHNGIIDITYTWNRQGILHTRFNQAWLLQQQGSMKYVK